MFKYYTKSIDGKLHLCSRCHDLTLCTPNARKMAFKANFAHFKIKLLKTIEKTKCIFLNKNKLFSCFLCFVGVYY